jgi:hypothetical protein
MVFNGLNFMICSWLASLLSRTFRMRSILSLSFFFCNYHDGILFSLLKYHFSLSLFKFFSPDQDGLSSHSGWTAPSG